MNDNSHSEVGCANKWKVHFGLALKILSVLSFGLIWLLFATQTQWSAFWESMLVSVIGQLFWMTGAKLQNASRNDNGVLVISTTDMLSGLYGIPPVCIGALWIYEVLRMSLQGNPPYTIAKVIASIIFCGLFVVAGLLIVRIGLVYRLGNDGVVLDSNQHIVTKWRRTLWMTKKAQTFPLRDFQIISIRAESRRSHLWYWNGFSITLRGKNAAVEIESADNEKEAVQLAADIASITKLPVVTEGLRAVQPVVSSEQHLDSP